MDEVNTMSTQLNFSLPVDQLRNAIETMAHDQEKFCLESLNKLGLFIIRKALPISEINHLYTEYKKYQNSAEFQRTKFHLTEVKVASDSPLRQILTSKYFTNILQNFFRGNVGLYNFRIVKKDVDDVAPVFLHQDIGYHVGGFERYSIFVPLTECNAQNGGLTLYPGTHHFGYLGDVGEIRDFLPNNYPRFTPALNPGDVIIMHSALWHASGSNQNGQERIYLDIHIQDADEPTTKEVLLGKRLNDWSLHLSHDEIFKNSRTQRLREFYQKDSKSDF